MEQIKNILTDLGLSNTEIEIYLTGLSFSQLSASEIAKNTKIKRPTVYHALETLMDKGLAAKNNSDNKTKYLMCKPEKIKKLVKLRIDKMERQEKRLDKLIPLLSQRMKTKKQQDIVVSLFEGIEGIKTVVEEALYCRSRQWDIIAPPKNFFSEFDKDYAKYYIEARKRKNISARSLWEEITNQRALAPEEIKQRQPRFLPKVMHGKFKSVIILFDDKVAIISSFKELTAVLIKSQEFFDTHKAIFDGLWEISKDYKEK